MNPQKELVTDTVIKTNNRIHVIYTKTHYTLYNMYTIRIGLYLYLIILLIFKFGNLPRMSANVVQMCVHFLI